MFIQVLLKLYAKFQPSTMSGSGLKVCGGGGGGWWVGGKPNLVNSIDLGSS